MIPALVHGKLPSDQENLEDLLTSNVFGCLRYLPYAAGLYRFLSFADDPAFVDALPRPSEELEVEYRFWPWLDSGDGVGCEPDVLVSFRRAGVVEANLLIEAKHLSKKSSLADPTSDKVTDQLAREWVCLVAHCRRHGGRPILLYVTSEYGRNPDDFLDAVAEIGQKAVTAMLLYPFTAAWLSWRHLSTAFERPDGVIAQDLLSLVERMDFRFFEGVRPIRSRIGRGWQLVDRFDFSLVRSALWSGTVRSNFSVGSY